MGCCQEKSMNQEQSIILRQTLWQVPVLILLSGLIAIGVNHLRANSIPLIGDWSTGSRVADTKGESLVIDLEQARVLFEQNAVQFVDARPPSQYAEGHVRGALSLPLQEVDRYFVETADRLESQKTIVTYCDGESCDLSHELALFLKEMGFENVRVLVNGWTVWQEAGLPTDKEMN